MSDDVTTDDATPDDMTTPDAAPDAAPDETASTNGGADGSTTSARPPSPGALAASRARRIGGRPTPGPRPGPAGATTTSSASATGPVKAPVSATKQRRADRRRDRSRASEGTARAGQVSVRALGWVFAWVAGVVGVVLAAGTVWLSHGVWWDQPSASSSQSQQVRQQVLAAATTCLSAVTNYDYRSIPAAEKAGLACATGTFRAAYKKAMETTVTAYAPQSKTAQTFQANKAGIISVSPDGKQWVVLLYGQQSVTNTQHSATSPQLDVLSARVTLNQVGGKWLISALAQA